MSDGWTCIARNPESGVSTWAMRGEGDDVYIQERQDLSALLDENKAIRNMSSQTWKGDGLHSVARIPLAMLHDKADGVGRAIDQHDNKWVTRFLNDSDNENLRTKSGVL